VGLPITVDVHKSYQAFAELDYLAVHPENKGKGVATALVESGLKQAEAMGVDVFIMAFKAGRGVYARLGFREVDRVIQDDSKFGGPGEYAAYFMVYHVKKSDGGSA
jgi:predicted N-acetyltransferase YhbS